VFRLRLYSEFTLLPDCGFWAVWREVAMRITRGRLDCLLFPYVCGRDVLLAVPILSNGQVGW
jgi:hypothetical protein